MLIYSNLHTQWIKLVYPRSDSYTHIKTHILTLTSTLLNSHLDNHIHTTNTHLYTHRFTLTISHWHIHQLIYLHDYTCILILTYATHIHSQILTNQNWKIFWSKLPAFQAILRSLRKEGGSPKNCTPQTHMQNFTTLGQALLGEQ